MLRVIWFGRIHNVTSSSDPHIQQLCEKYENDCIWTGSWIRSLALWPWFYSQSDGALLGKSHSLFGTFVPSCSIVGGQGWVHLAPKCSQLAPLGAEDEGRQAEAPKASHNQSFHVFRSKTRFPWLSLPTQVSVSPQPGSSSVSRAGSLHKSTAQPEEKKLETTVSRLERRDQLKKANTLPTSVTGREQVHFCLTVVTGFAS